MLNLPRRTAFTLLELIVVLVVLALLAALAIPTFARVTQTSQLRTAETTLAALSREAVALARMGDASASDLSAAAVAAGADLSTTSAAGRGLTAAQSPWKVWVDRSVPSSTGRDILARVSTSAGSPVLDTALHVPGAGCAFARASTSGAVTTSHRVSDLEGSDCTTAVGAALSDGGNIALLLPPSVPRWSTKPCSSAKGPDGTPRTCVVVTSSCDQSYDVYAAGTKVGTITFPACPELVLNTPSPDITLVPAGWTFTTTPGAPSGYVSEPTAVSGATTVNWNPSDVPAGTTSVRVYRDGALVATMPNPGAAFVIDPSAATGVRYQAFPVVAAREVAPIRVTIAPTPAPAPVVPAVNLACSVFGTVTHANGTYSISWAPPAADPRSPVTSYRLYRQPQGGSNWGPSAKVYDGPATTFNDVYAAAVAYRVSAVGPGGESALSPVQCAAPPVALATPVLTTTSTSISSVSLRWNYVESATAYEVGVKTTTGSWSTVATVTANSATVSGLPAATDHQFRVRAIQGGASSDWAQVNARTATTSGTTSADVALGRSGTFFNLGGTASTGAYVNPVPSQVGVSLSTSAYGGNDASRVTNRTKDSFYWSSGSGSPWIAWDFTKHPIAVSSWSILGASSGGGNAGDGIILSGTTLQGSMDGKNWTTLTTVSGDKPADSWYTFTSTDTTTKWNHIKLQRANGGLWWKVDEVEFYGSVTP